MASTMEIIQAEYPGRITLTADELAPLIQLSVHYIRREVRAGTFPIPWKRIGSRILFPVAAVATSLDEGITPPPPPPRKPGRPKKTDTIKRNQAQYSSPLMPEHNNE